MALHLSDNEIGGGIVRRRFRLGTEDVVAGRKLTAEEVRGIPIANRRALIDSQYLEVWPAMTSPEGTKFLVNRGDGKFDVVCGVLLNDKPLSKAQAQHLLNAN